MKASEDDDRQGPAPPTTAGAAGVVHVGFVLLRDYSMIAFVNALETLRMANYISRRTLYRWSVVSAEPADAVASNGLALQATADPSCLAACDLVLVCGGIGVRAAVTDPVRRLVRDCAARHTPLGALCTGSFALASAGVLDGHRCAIHWENLAAISEEFPEVTFTTEVFVVDRDRITCSGGTAPLHLMLHLVRARHGSALARQISEQFIVERVRSADDRQRIPQPECIGPGYQHLSEATAIMAANIEEPLSLVEVAASAGISLRQLARLFQRYYSMTPAQHYLNLRLGRARELLMHSSMPVMQITIACGFQSSSHFCRAYRTLFGHPPSQERQRLAAADTPARAGPSSRASPEPRVARRA